MSAPLPIQLLDAIALRLPNISKARGYYTDVGKIKRATLKPFQDQDLPALNYWPGTDNVVARGAGWVERLLPLVVEYYDRTRDRPFSDVVFELAQDVVVAVQRDPDFPAVSDNPEFTLGGLCRSVQLVSVVPQVGEGQAPFCGALLTFDLVYRVKAGDPTSFV